MKREIMFFCKICKKYDHMAWLEAMKQICRNCLIKSKSYTKKQLTDMDKEIKIISTNELTKLLNPNTHIGEVPDQCTKYINEIINPIISKYKTRLGKMTGK